MVTNRNWEFQSRHDMLVACVGNNFGPDPESRLEDIRIARGAYGDTVAHRLKLFGEDVVMDIGSGCGFVGRRIAPRAKALHCADLSAPFLDFCRQELAEFPNVQFHLIGYADYSALEGAGLTCAYSTAVWIHFNYYDFYHNLSGLARVLPAGGRVYLDYADPSGIPAENARIFNEHSSNYLGDRSAIFKLVQYNGLSAILAVLDQTGFDLIERWQTHEDCYSILIRKR